jgi:glycosyltransferase 2 family protein
MQQAMSSELQTASPGRAARVRRYLPWLGLLLLAWVLSRFDLRALGDAFARVRIQTVGQAALLFAFNLLLKSFRWQRMLSAQGLVLPTRVAVAAFFSSQFYGQVTLGRLGELYRAEVLTERGVPVGTALSSSLYDRLLDVAAVLVVAAAVSASVLGSTQAAIAAGASMLLVIALCIALARANVLASLPPVMRLRAWLQARRGTRGALGLLGQLVSGLGPLLRPAFILEAVLWTAAAWLCYFASLWVLSQGMGLSASRLALTAAAALGALSSLLPVTISGLGAREVIFMHVLALEQVSAPRAVVLSLLQLCVMTAAAIGLGLIGMLARHRQQRIAAASSRS